MASMFDARMLAVRSAVPQKKAPDHVWFLEQQGQGRPRWHER